MMKSLDIVSTADVHAQEISRLLLAALARRHNSDAKANILITGSTDETMVRLAHTACNHAGVEIQLHSVDICNTPLLFMQRYSIENDIPLDTYHADILEFDPGQQFDIILTHAFMGYFDRLQRAELVRKWRSLLSHDGRVVTIQRVRPADSPELVRFTPTQKRAFIDTATGLAMKAVTNPEMSAQYTVDMVRDAATKFTRNFRSHAIRSHEELEATFTDAGLIFDLLEYHTVTALSTRTGTVTGPSVPSDAEFAHIIACDHG